MQLVDNEKLDIDTHELMLSLKIAYKDKKQSGRSANRASNRQSRNRRNVRNSQR